MFFEIFCHLNLDISEFNHQVQLLDTEEIPNPENNSVTNEVSQKKHLQLSSDRIIQPRLKMASDAKQSSNTSGEVSSNYTLRTLRPVVVLKATSFIFLSTTFRRALESRYMIRILMLRGIPMTVKWENYCSKL